MKFGDRRSICSFSVEGEVINKRLQAFFVAATVIASGLASPASLIAGASPSAEIRREHEEYARMFDVLLTRMKAEVKLTHDQENNWRRFEAAVHRAAEAHRDATETLGRLKAGEKPSPIKQVRTIADHMAKGSDQAKDLADAAEPLFESLTVEQKGKFGRLLQMLVERLPYAEVGLHRWGHDKVEEPGRGRCRVTKTAPAPASPSLPARPRSPSPQRDVERAM
jgi:hypothetical protein